ncbi:MAG: metallophosphoesterase [Ignavibacteriae bacterium]|nr:metallophosphoesterase [Ignavibacteriota bacterium]
MSKKMIKNMSLKIVAITLLIVVVTMLSGCNNSTEPPVGTGETFRFVFLADSRGEALDHPVNDTVLNAIITQISMLSPKPSFVMFGGDMSYRGYIDTAYTFQAWKNLFAPLTGSGITLYAAVGNHELYHQHSSYGLLKVNQQAFQSAFPESPSNGPVGYEHLAYSFSAQGGNAFFAVLDPYFLTMDTTHEGLGGDIEYIQMQWLRSQVAQTSAKHKFLFIHTPYYYVSSDTAEPSGSNQTLTTLWSFLDSNKFDMYACGHSHLYARKTIDSTILPEPQTTPPTSKWRNNVVQLINGTCGAGSGGGYIDPQFSSWNVHNAHKTYYFSVVDILGSTVTVNSYSGYTGVYTVFDTFTITR